MQPHIVANQADEAHAHSQEDPKEGGDHRDGNPSEKVEPGVVLWALKKSFFCLITILYLLVFLFSA